MPLLVQGFWRSQNLSSGGRDRREMTLVFRVSSNDGKGKVITPLVAITTKVKRFDLEQTYVRTK